MRTKAERAVALVEAAKVLEDKKIKDKAVKLVNKVIDRKVLKLASKGEREYSIKAKTRALKHYMIEELKAQGFTISSEGFYGSYMKIFFKW